MARLDGFLTIDRTDPPYRPIDTRVSDFFQVKLSLAEDSVSNQANRCMDCGVPFCHMYGCPLGNRIPDYTESVADGNWREALEILHSTNNFPEITGRVCPALCEAACTLAVNFTPSLCQHIEMRIAEHAWDKGWILPKPPLKPSGKRVAVVGSGPAGLSAAQQLRRSGHEVVVFEKSDRIGGLLMYGIPNFKLEKWVIERRLEQMGAEGVLFETKVEVGSDISPRYLLDKFDAILLATGTPTPRDLDISGRQQEGIYQAVDFLTQQTRLVLGDEIGEDELIDARGKHVVVIGGGDTGSDCVGSVIRRGCASVTQIELLPQPPNERTIDNPWPQWPKILRTSSSHEEGCDRLWSIGSKKFVGDGTQVKKLACVRLQWSDKGFEEIPQSEFTLDADLVLLSMGFSGNQRSPLVESFGLSLDERGNIAIDQNFRTSVEKVFAAGDAITGASLVVRTIDSGRRCAQAIDSYLFDECCSQ